MTICIVPWNSEKWTEHFRHELRLHTLYPYTLIVSDNSDEPHAIPSAPGVLEYLWNGGNIGFARATNRAIRLAPSDLVVITNCDINLQEGWLRKLVKAYMETDFAIIAPTTNSRMQHLKDFGGKPRGTVETIWAPVCSLWMTSKSRLFNKTGYWDESFEGVSCGDFTHCWRAWKAGGRVGICTDVYIHHHAHKVVEGNISHEEYQRQIDAVKVRLKQIYGPEFSDRKPT